MISKIKFSDAFKRDAVLQITERGYLVAEVLQRLGVSQHSLYACKKKFSRPSGGDDKDAEIRRLKRWFSTSLNDSEYRIYIIIARRMI